MTEAEKIAALRGFALAHQMIARRLVLAVPSAAGDAFREQLEREVKVMERALAARAG